MSAIVPTLRAIVREELAAARACELGIVTQVFSNDGGGGDNNLAINVRLRGSALELQKVPFAVARPGLSALPRVDDLVVLAFVGGDLNAPVALGFLYDEQVRPPDAKPGELVYTVPEDEEDGARRLAIVLPSGHKLTLEDKKLSIVMGSSKLTIEADGAISIEAGGDLTFKASGALKLEASGEASLKGSSVKVEGQSSATLKGTTTTISGTTNFSAT